MSFAISEKNMQDLLIKTDAFIDTMYYVRHDLTLLPKKEHVCTCINFSDLIEMREDFIRELVGSVVDYVYSTKKSGSIRDKLLRGDRRSLNQANESLSIKAKEKFRKSSIKGQFSELLLFLLLQHHFHAIPLLRKMPITTEPNIERNGADAFHIAMLKSKFILFLGEAKTYDREKYGLKRALTDSITSILKHYKDHRSELNLYSYEEFIPEELESVATEYLSGERDDFEVHLVCLVAFDGRLEIQGKSRSEKLNFIIETVKKTISNANKKIFENIPEDLKPRFNYIIFPINSMQGLLDDFKNKLGIL